MTLREKIDTELYSAFLHGGRYQKWNRREATDRILAAVREAMLIGADGFIVAKDENGESLGAFATKPWMEQILTAAGITGAGQEGGGDE